MFTVPYVPMRDPDAAFAWLRAVLERSPVAITGRNAPVPVPDGYIFPFSDSYEAFWALAEEAGVVVATHAGNDEYNALVQMWEPRGPESSLFRSPLRGVLTKARAVGDFYAAAICDLLFERHSGLRLASVENGVGWIPDLLHRLDDAANRYPGYFRDHPRDLFGEHVWVRPLWEDQIESFGDDVRVDRLLMASDWPHAEGTVAPLDFIDEALGSLDGDDLDRVLHHNPLEVLDITLG
jgi:predicted TIM-barrel fold metal-dependent hydrolase